MRASDADYWSTQPNADGILAMGMIKVIIEEELYHKQFVKEWCVGFDELREEMKNFTLDDVEKYSWIPRNR
jgi:anaerobic selenocysteine-containing dehydrogenase